MADYKSLQVAQALQRVNEQLKPKSTSVAMANTVFAQNTNTPDATVNTVNALKREQQYYNSLYSKTGSDYLQDGAVALAKGIVAVPQAAAGLVDIADAGYQSLTSNDPVKAGRFTKALDDIGVQFQDTQDIMAGWYSEGTQKQFQELSQLPGMSTEKSLGENLSSLGQTAKYVLQNPSLAANAVVESLPLIGAGGVIGRGVGMLGKGGAAVAGAAGEGTVMAGSAMANMPKNAEGYATGTQALGALGIGVLGGAVGQLGRVIGSRSGASDIDSIVAGSTPVANQGFKSLASGTATEATEEAAQTALENVITNVSSGQDAIQGLNQDLVLGTLAGGIMGAGTNAPSAVKSAALSAVYDVAVKQSEKIKERINKVAPEKSDTATEDFVNPASTNYNPKAAVARIAKDIKPDSTAEDLVKVKTDIEGVIDGAETHLDSLVKTQQALTELPVTRNKLASMEQIVPTMPPEQQAQFQPMMDSLRTQIQVAEQFVGKESELSEAIGTAQEKVNEVRDAYSNYEGLLNKASERANKGNPTTEEPMSTVDSIFAAPHSFSLEEINAEIENPNLPEEKRAVLRQLSEAKVLQNSVKDIDAVNNQVVGKKLDPNYRSTPQYMEQFSRALKSGSEVAQNNLLREIAAFEESHVGKTEALALAMDIARNQGTKAQIVREDGKWTVRTTDILKDGYARYNGAYTVNPSNKGLAAASKVAEYMDAEAKAITATHKAMVALKGTITPTQTQQAPQQANSAPVVDPLMGSEAIAPTTTSEPIPQAPINTVDNSGLEVPTAIDPMQAELDAFNAEARNSNEWNQGSRTEDPRQSGKPITNTSSNPVSQGTAPKAKGNAEIPVTPPKLGDVVFNESGVGTAKEVTNESELESEVDTSTTGTGKTTEQQITELKNGIDFDAIDGDWDAVKNAEDALVKLDPSYVRQHSDKYSSSPKPTKAEAQTSEVAEGSVSEPKATKAKSSVTKEQAQDVLEGKYSEDTHVVYEKPDGNWDVRAKTLDEQLEDVSNEVHAFDESDVYDDTGTASDVVTSTVEAEESVSNKELREAERAKPIQERNLIVDGFNRKDVPLTKAPNLHEYLADQSKVRAVIKRITDIDPTKEHTNVVSDYLAFRNAIAGSINGSVNVRRVKNPAHKDFEWQDYLQFLVNDDGTFNDDVISAVSVAGYLYVAENAQDTTLTESEIASILRVKNADTIPESVAMAFREIGDHRNTVIKSLGQRAAQALGYKQLSDVSELRTSKLYDALGSLALRGLNDLGMIHQTAMPSEQFNEYREAVLEQAGVREDNVSGLSTSATYNFVQVAQNDSTAQVVSNNEKTNSVMSKLFATKPVFTMPVLAAPTELVKNTFNDKGTVYPSEAVETTLKSQA